MISTAPLVTVGIPFFDEEEHLPFAIRSVLAQTWTSLEVLLVDDGSRDHSVEIARSFRDERVKVLSDGERRYLPARLNQIVEHARGELIARMDADDVAHPDRLRRQIEALQNGDGIASGTWAGLIDDDDVPFGVIECASHPTAAVALERGLIPHPTLIARRDWLKAFPYDEKLTRAEDRDLWARAFGTRFANIDEPLYLLRISRESPRFLPDYLESQRQNRILYARYGMRALGPLRTARRYGESLAKGWIMSGAMKLGLADRLVRRRGRPPTAREHQLILEALQASRP